MLMMAASLQVHLDDDDDDENDDDADDDDDDERLQMTTMIVIDDSCFSNSKPCRTGGPFCSLTITNSC